MVTNNENSLTGGCGKSFVVPVTPDTAYISMLVHLTGGHTCVQQCSCVEIAIDEGTPSLAYSGIIQRAEKHEKQAPFDA